MEHVTKEDGKGLNTNNSDNFHGTKSGTYVPSLTKLEYFAGLAMQSLLTLKETAPEFVAVQSVDFARDLIVELNKTIYHN